MQLRVNFRVVLSFKRSKLSFLQLLLGFFWPEEWTSVHCSWHNTTGCHDSHWQTMPLADYRTRHRELGRERERGGPALNRGQSIVNNCKWMAADNALLYFMSWSYTVSGKLGSEATQQHVACTQYWCSDAHLLCYVINYPATMTWQSLGPQSVFVFLHQIINCLWHRSILAVVGF